MFFENIENKFFNDFCRDSTHSSPSPQSSGSNNSSQESLQKQQKRKGLKGSLGRMFKREKSRSLPRDSISNRELPSEPTIGSSGELPFS